MAEYIAGIAALGPRIARTQPVSIEELTQRLADTTGQRIGEIMRVLLELQITLLFYTRKGRSVEMPGIGTFRPIIKSDGRIQMKYRPNHQLISRLDVLKLFEGEILNRENIGISFEDLKVLWDEAHPDDPLLPPRLRIS